MKHIKFLLTVLTLLFSLAMHAQQLDGFKYVWVQTLEYTDNTIDKWGISAKVRDAFVNKGFVLLTNEVLERIRKTEEIQSVLKIYIDHTNVIEGVNRVTLTLTDIDDHQVMTMKGGGAALSLQGDYNMATNNALKTLSAMKYRFDPSKSPKEYLPEVEKTDWTENKLREYYDTASEPLSRLEGIYKSIVTEDTGEMRLGIFKDGFTYKAVIISSEDYRWKPGEVKAVFELANGTYSVSWYMGNKTKVETFGGWTSNGLLEVDLKSKDAGVVDFVKIYPLTTSNNGGSINGGNGVGVSKPSDKAKASGTGFVISKDGYIATNAHVVSDASRITVDLLGNDGLAKQYEADIAVVDATNDVAIIKINDNDFKNFTKIPYTLEPRVNVGAEVFTIGFPLNTVMGTNYKVANGIISAKTGIDDDIRYYQITVPIQPGNSGGPLINKDGNIVGITSSRLNGDYIGTHVENVNYAVKALYLLNAINSVPKMEEMPETSSLVGKNMEQQIDIIKDYICLIKIY